MSFFAHKPIQGFLPMRDDAVWIVTEYISNKKRDQNTNWGTFIGMLPLADGD